MAANYTSAWLASRIMMHEYFLVRLLIDNGLPVKPVGILTIDTSDSRASLYGVSRMASGLQCDPRLDYTSGTSGT